MAANGGGIATAGQQQKHQQGGPPQQGVQAKRTSRWAGWGNNNSSSSSSNTPSQQNARAQSPLNPSTGKPAASPANAPSHAGPTAGAAAPSPATFNATPEELAKMHDRMKFLFANLMGHKVRCTLRTGIVYTAILSTISEADSSVCLKLARQVEPPLYANGTSTPGTGGSPASSAALPPPKPSLVVPAKDVVDIYAENVSLDAATTASGASRPTSPHGATSPSSPGASDRAAMNNIMAALGGDTFRTDTDISGIGTSREQRELQRWGSGGDALEGGVGGLEDGGLESSSTGGGGHRGKGGAWDQFAVNEKLFGTKTNYQEEIYTTKLDKSGADYKAREARAAKIAEEIQSGAAINSHVAEERGGSTSFVDDSGLDEEDKYSGVIRGQNAYVPPGARRALAIQKPPATETAKANGAQAAATPAAASAETKPTASSAVGQATPVTPAAQQPPASTTVTPANKEDLVGDFKKFVSNEKEKLVQKRSQLEKQNKDKRMAELKQWSAAFVLKTPVPADLVPILAKDETKQKEIVNRKPTPSVAPSASAAANALKPASTHTSPNPQAAALANAAQLPPRLSGAAQPAAPEQKKASAWSVPTIPPFDPQRAAAARAAKAAAAGTPAASDTKSAAPTSATKFNVAAKEFVFRPTAGAFVPGAPVAAPAAPAATPSPAPASAASPSPLVRKPSENATPNIASSSTPVQPLNPFFGTRIIRNNNNAPFRVKEDFSPFKRNEKIPDPSTVQPAWGFTGKTYKAAASYSFPSTSTAVHAVSPQPSHALPPHMQQGVNGRLHGVASPPLSSQASHLSRTSSGQGPSTHPSSLGTSGPSSEDGGIGKSGLPTPVPSSNTSISGQVPGMQHHPQQAGGPTHGQMHAIPGMPQGYVFQPQPGQPYAAFRYVPGAPHQSPGHVQSPGGQQGQHMHLQPQQIAGHQMQVPPGAQFIMGPNGAVQFLPPGAMLSPHMAGQMGHPPFMQPMHMPQQGGMRGQNGQMMAGQPHQFYPVQGSPAMHPHYVQQMAQQQGMPTTPSQQMFEQPGQ